MIFRESKTRSILKTLSWRVLATATTFSLVLIFVGRVSAALAVGGLEVIVKLAVYYLHERVWDKIVFGRKEIRPVVIWLTGLPCSGKQKIGDAVSGRLAKRGFKVEHLHAGSVDGLLPETGFTKEEMHEHTVKVGHLARKLEKQGVFVVVSFVSPFAASREAVKDLCDNYVEVHVATPIEICEQNDIDGLYRRARAGELKNVVGVDIAYEAPTNGAIRIDGGKLSAEQAAEVILKEGGIE